MSKSYPDPNRMTIRIEPSHIEMMNQAAGSGRVNYSAFIRTAIEQTYGQKKAG